MVKEPINTAKNSTKGIVLVGGVFDILHYGHIHFLKKAKSLGNYLIVAIESDVRVKEMKGDTRPFHTQDQRKEILESLNFVDEIIILKDRMTDQNYFDIISEIRPSVIAVTAGDPIVDKKKSHAEKVGATVIEIEKIAVPSTTQIAKLMGLE